MNKEKIYSIHRKPIAGYTLVEIMVATFILGIVGLGLFAFTTESAKSAFWSVNKSLITKDFRQFTQELSQDALNASHAYLYRSFNPADCDADDDRVGNGECLVLITTTPFPQPNDDRFYDKVVIYYRAAAGPQERPVFRIERDMASPPTIPTTTPIEDFIAAERSNFTQPVTVIESTTGLANGQLFNRITNEAFLINAEINYGNEFKKVSNTYNLTISTRG